MARKPVVVGFEGPTKERLAQAGCDFEMPDPRQSEVRGVRMTDGDLLGRLAKLGTISQAEQAAGEQFYADWYFGGLAASGVIDSGRVVVDGGRGFDMTARQMDALQRYHRAVQALGMMLSQVMTDVVLMGEPLQSYGRRRFGSVSPKLAVRDATTALKLALAQLVLHYTARGGMRSGMVDGARPRIMGRGEGA